MFDYSILHWTTFVTAAILLNLSPGPDIAFILGQTVRGGRRAGFAAMAGIWTGALVHVGFVAAGLTAILASSAVAFSIVKWVGTAYLIYLGLSALGSKGGKFINDKVEISPSGLKVMRQGVLVSLLNPKVAFFFLAFLPQFVVPGWVRLGHSLHCTAHSSSPVPPKTSPSTTPPRPSNKSASSPISISPITVPVFPISSLPSPRSTAPKPPPMSKPELFTVVSDAKCPSSDKLEHVS